MIIGQSSMMSYRTSISTLNYDEGEINIMEDAKAEREELARQEEKAVRLLRIFVFVGLLITSSFFCVGVYFYTRQNQVQTFNDTFTSNALKITESFQLGVANTMGALDSLAISITSYAISSGSKFPNVTIPDFEVKASSARVLSGCWGLWWMPLVTNVTRHGWEAYTINASELALNDYTVDTYLMKTQDYQLGLGNQSEQPMQGDDPPPLPVSPRIFGSNMLPRPDDLDLYLPVWQISPVIPSLPLLLNYDYLDRQETRPIMDKAIETKKAVVGPMVDLRSSEQEKQMQTEAVANMSIAGSQFRYSQTEFESDGLSNGAYPVYDTFGPNRTLVGLILYNIYWKLLFVNVLPTADRGYICVFRTCQNQSFTYRIDGPNVTLIGVGDLHDRKYDNMMVTTNIIDGLKKYLRPEKLSYTSVAIADDYVNYFIDVYPCNDLSDEYVNNKPIMYMIVVLAIFLLTSGVFVAYDRYVAKRQAIVMSRAVASSAIVSSLFPSKIRARIYEENEIRCKNYPRQKPTECIDHNISSSSFTATKTFSSMSSKKHLADVFLHTTVFFGDLVGFTKWSSARDPSDVFDLLETIYAAFDASAQKWGVFKIETIGDCYVAITGCPNPQQDHASRMVHFALDCMIQMSKSTIDLAEYLGESTKDIQLRIGLNSGSVTAGVLRGARGRFQLFGDTVNVASRMESSSYPGQIHVSQATADELIASGDIMESWIVPREPKITIKGKGELQTYFIRSRETDIIISHIRGHHSSSSSEIEAVEL